MNISEEIHTRLEAAFAPQRLEVVDDSESHRGHAGWREGGQTHFQVTIRAEALSELSRVARHRAIHTAIGKELIGRIHALEITVVE